MREELFCGIDIGASAIKVVLIDVEANVVARAIRPGGSNVRQALQECLGEIEGREGLRASGSIRSVATGYGRAVVETAQKAITEIQAHTRGCFYHFPRAFTLVDIGGQDNKVIKVDEAGRVVHFRMNRKCAAGTGAFLEEIAAQLGITLKDMNALGETASQTVKLGSFCTVFTKTEILTHIKEGKSIPGLVRGAFHSVVNRIMEMDSLSGEVVATGGVIAHNPMVVSLIAERTGREVRIPPWPQFSGAFGAALVAREEFLKESGTLRQRRE